MPLVLEEIVRDFADAVELADRKRPQARNARTGQAFHPGIGPHTESQTVRLVMQELATLQPAKYGNYKVGVRYRDASRLSCDLCLGTAPNWDWAIEVKMLRFLGDNGKANDNILMHLLSPYAGHRSALTDCEKLTSSTLASRVAVLVYGFDHANWPLAPAIEAFEALARLRVRLGPRCSAPFSGLVHPVHQSGQVFAWEIWARDTDFG